MSKVIDIQEREELLDTLHERRIYISGEAIDLLLKKDSPFEILRKISKSYSPNVNK